MAYGAAVVGMLRSSPDQEAEAPATPRNDAGTWRLTATSRELQMQLVDPPCQIVDNHRHPCESLFDVARSVFLALSFLYMLSGGL
jgi:hypothetical protein